MQYTEVTDTTLLPYENEIEFARYPVWSYSDGLSLSDAFEDGLRIGDTYYHEISVIQSGIAKLSDQFHFYPFGAADAFVDSRHPASAVYFDTNTERDSIVVTWHELKNYFRANTDDVVTFQMEIMDLGDGDAEVIFRHPDLYDPPFQTWTHFFVMGLGVLSRTVT